MICLKMGGRNTACWLILLAVDVTGLLSDIPVAAIAAEQPNVIFMMADDMGYADAGCFGGKYIKTPNVDQLAREGMRFTDCYAGSTVCAPSRSVLMTGQHTGHTRVRGNFGVGGVRGLGGGNGRVPLHADDLTVAEVLKQAGYRTGMTGKWGLGEPQTDGQPNRQGFDQWFGFLNQRRAHNHYPEFMWLNENRFDLPGNEAGRQQQYAHDLFAGFATHFIRANQDRPFFLYIPFTVPHSRFDVPDFGPYKDEEWPAKERAYAAMITRMDRDVGRILRLLDELEIRKKTVVFFCSDNGAADRYDELFRSSGELRGRKRDMFEGGLRTPMVVSWPGTVPADRTSDAPWYFADFLPTAAEIAGTAVPRGIDGVSVLPTLLGEDQPELFERFMYWEFFERGFRQAARWRRWKAIRPNQGAALELYDLRDDIGESRDVASRNSEVVARFEAFFRQARTESQEWPLPR